MNRIEIDEFAFSKLMNGVKRSVSTGGYRESLEYIQLKVSTDKVVAFSTDGYRAARVEIKHTYPIDEEFVCYIKPIPIKASKRLTGVVVIEKTEKETFVEVPTAFGSCRYRFASPKDNYIDTENIYRVAKVHDREISFRVSAATNALRALDGMNNYNYATIETSDDKTKAFVIRAEQDGIINEQIILPMRKF